MPHKRVTVQDIADACGLSRTTVSKIFNNHAGVPDSTRQTVLTKAREMGYFDSRTPALSETVPRNIAVLSCSNPVNHHFGSLFIKGFTDMICREGYSVQMYELSREERLGRKLPSHLALENTVGILGIELFDRDYTEFICSLGLPVIIADCFCEAPRSLIPCDIISMENITSTRIITEKILSSGAKKLGFVGDIRHCNSFFERWTGFCSALERAQIKPDKAYCILAEDGSHYAETDWTVGQLGSMPELPDAFVCANDYHAVKLTLALKEMGLSIPGDIMVAGFGNDPESSILGSGLTTVNIPSAEIGTMAASILLTRRSAPEAPYLLTYVQTKPIFRGSTR